MDDASDDGLVQLENWHYQVELGGGYDSWRLNGEVYGHPNYSPGASVHVSTPKAFDESKMIITTASGRKYRLGNCDGNLDEQMGHIRDDITRGGTQKL